MHEELLQELEAQYEVNKSMYEQIENWNELFLEFQEFEVKPTKNRFDLEFSCVLQKNASDPQRFHRRGYSALAEEKTRKKLEATLREYEIRLNHLAEDFAIKNNGQPFVMGSIGKQIPEYIQQRREDYVKTKEKEREALKVSESKENKCLSVS